MNYEMIMAVSAVVAAYVGAFKALKLQSVPDRYLPFVAVAFAAVFFVVPEWLYQLMMAVSMAGLGAVGVYKLSGKGGK